MLLCCLHASVYAFHLVNPFLLLRCSRVTRTGEAFRCPVVLLVERLHSRGIGVLEVSIQCHNELEQLHDAYCILTHHYLQVLSVPVGIVEYSFTTVVYLVICVSSENTGDLDVLCSTSTTIAGVSFARLRCLPLHTEGFFNRLPDAGRPSYPTWQHDLSIAALVQSC